jgi:hypothetical protein
VTVSTSYIDNMKTNEFKTYPYCDLLTGTCCILVCVSAWKHGCLMQRIFTCQWIKLLLGVEIEKCWFHSSHYGVINRILSVVLLKCITIISHFRVDLFIFIAQFFLFMPRILMECYWACSVLVMRHEYYKVMVYVKAVDAILCSITAWNALPIDFAILLNLCIEKRVRYDWMGK